jgi:hypothetical protein
LNTTAHKLLIQGTALLLCLAWIALLTVAGAIIVELIYNLTHAIPDPVERGEDLGTGFAALFGLVIGFACSIPTSFFVYGYVLRHMTKSPGSR